MRNNLHLREEEQPLLIRIMVLIAAVLVRLTCRESGAERESVTKTRSDESYFFSYTPLYQFNTDLDGGGGDVNSHLFRFSTVKSVGLKNEIGLGYDLENWDFTDVLSVAGQVHGIPFTDLQSAFPFRIALTTNSASVLHRPLIFLGSRELISAIILCTVPPLCFFIPSILDLPWGSGLGNLTVRRKQHSFTISFLIGR